MVNEPIIQELWVISNCGTPLYNQCLHETYDPTRFGSLIAGLQQLAHSLDSGGCKAVRIGDSQLSLTQCPGVNLMIACRSNLDTKEARIFKYLENIRGRFLQKFGEILKHWDGDEGIFADFVKVVDLRNDTENWLGVTINKGTLKDIINQL